MVTLAQKSQPYKSNTLRPRNPKLLQFGRISRSGSVHQSTPPRWRACQLKPPTFWLFGFSWSKDLRSEPRIQAEPAQNVPEAGEGQLEHRAVTVSTARYDCRSERGPFELCAVMGQGIGFGTRCVESRGRFRV